MSEDAYLTNHCQHCDGGIEFPQHGVGAEIECPHCKRSIRLVMPPELEAAVPSAGQPVPEGELSPAGLLFLSKFLSPSEIGALGGVERWNSVLDGHPTAVIDGFLEGGLLEKVTPDLVSLLCSKSSYDLKTFAKERGLPQSGMKPVLERRLAKADSEGMAHLFCGRTYLSCTPVGRGLAERFLEAGAKAEQEAQDQSLVALRQRQFEEACRVVATFEASCVFGRGVGTDWQAYEPTRDSGILSLIFSESLARHAELDEKALANIRVAAAMMQLWGTNNPRPYLEEGLNHDGVDWAVEARMLLFRGLGIVRLQEMKSAGIQRVKVLWSGGGGLAARRVDPTIRLFTLLTRPRCCPMRRAVAGPAVDASSSR
jgi:hypothetical protein